LDVLIAPVLTEKALMLHRDGKYTFYVRKDANKIDINVLWSRFLMLR